MAEKVTIQDFVRWCITQIDPAIVSELMTKYGYTDDSIESVMMAMQVYPNFVTEFGQLLGEAIASRKSEINRSVGGYKTVDTEPELVDWYKALKKNKINFATGDSNDIAKSAFDWTTVVNTVVSVAGITLSSIFGNKNQQADGSEFGSVSTKNTPTQTTSGSTTFVWIILGFVVLAIIGIFAISLSKKK